MKRKQFIALAWKEYRQLRSVYIALTLCMVLFVRTLHHIQIESSDYFEMYQLLAGVFVITSILLAFFTGAGARMIDSADRLEKFLPLRPISYSDLFQSYLLFGCFGYLIWMTIYLSIQIVFFHFDLFDPGSVLSFTERSQLPSGLSYPWDTYLIAAFLYLVFYAIAFSAGNLLHRFSHFLGAVSFAYLFTFYITYIAIEANSFKYFTPILAAVVLILYSNYILYQHKEFGKR